MTPVWIVLFIAASFIGTLLMTTSGNLQNFCNAAVNSTVSNNTGLAEFKNIFSDYSEDIDAKLGKYASKWMCSIQCPCNSTSF